jgi:hypothetical protein
MLAKAWGRALCRCSRRILQRMATTHPKTSHAATSTQTYVQMHRAALNKMAVGCMMNGMQAMIWPKQKIRKGWMRTLMQICKRLQSGSLTRSQRGCIPWT